MDSAMQIDSARIKQLREQRAWSQEHLAAISGLSIRTIQRLETSGAASHESRLALAAAFGLDPADLAPAPATDTSSPASPGITFPNTRHRHTLTLLATALGLLALDLWHHHAVTWSKWPLFGIGLALLIRHLRHAPPPSQDSSR